MKILKPLINIAKTASVSSLETLQLPSKKLANVIKAPKALLEGYAKLAKKNNPFNNDTKQTPVKSSNVNSFVSKYL